MTTSRCIESFLGIENTISKFCFLLMSCLLQKSRLVSGQAALIGINIGHEDMLTYVDLRMKMRNDPGKLGPPSKYVGGEMRYPVASDFAHVAIAGEGASIVDPKVVVFVL